MRHQENKVTIRKRPYTVTRGLPHYVIGENYKRLVRLSREYDHMERRSSSARLYIVKQFESLYFRVYKESYGMDK